MREWDAEDFLELVWGESEGWVDLPAKVNGYWVPFYTEWPGDGIVTRRIDSSLRDGEDLYYSVAKFSQRGRQIEDVLPTSWLWADLDEIHPTSASKLGLHPTVGVESSPGRYQALWKLSRELRPGTLAKLNRALSYSLDADRGGWDLTQVLRIPGTRNFKYSGSPQVKLLWVEDSVVYDPKYVWKIVKEHAGEDLERATGSVQLPRKPVSSWAKRTLQTPISNVLEGERSNVLWRLECELAEAGLTQEEIFDAIWPCAWNKWRGSASGRDRLKRDIRKATRHVLGKALPSPRSRSESRDRSKSTKGEDPNSERSKGGDTADSKREPTALPFVSYSSFLAMRMEKPKWMIEGIWTSSSHGIIGGEPKTQKTTLALAMGMSVASGHPFLGEYPVHTSGPVLMVQEENSAWTIQDRMRKLAAFYGLISKHEIHKSPASPGELAPQTLDLDFPSEYPFYVLNNYGFDLSSDDHRDLLVSSVENIAPVLILLDPLYMMIGGANYEKGPELIPYLKWLMKLQQQSGASIAVLHHMGKASENTSMRRAGQKLLGSALFHGWVDSAFYTTKLDSTTEDRVRVRIEPEFRSMAPRGAIELDLWLGKPGDLEMGAELRTRTTIQRILDLVRSRPGITVNQIADEVERDRRTVLSMVRGTESFRLEGGKKGRGQTWKVFVTEEEA